MLPVCPKLVRQGWKWHLFAKNGKNTPYSSRLSVQILCTKCAHFAPKWWSHVPQSAACKGVMTCDHHVFTCEKHVITCHQITAAKGVMTCDHCHFTLFMTVSWTAMNSVVHFPRGLWVSISQFVTCRVQRRTAFEKSLGLLFRCLNSVKSYLVMRKWKLRAARNFTHLWMCAHACFNNFLATFWKMSQLQKSA